MLVICAGILVALPCAFILKRFQAPPAGSAGAPEERPRRDLAFSGTVYEIALVVMSAYMSYITAEVVFFLWSNILGFPVQYTVGTPFGAIWPFSSTV